MCLGTTGLGLEIDCDAALDERAHAPLRALAIKRRVVGGCFHLRTINDPGRVRINDGYVRLKPRLKRATRARAKKKEEAPGEAAPAETVAEATPEAVVAQPEPTVVETVAEPDTPPKPKKRGWWSLGGK